MPSLSAPRSAALVAAVVLVLSSGCASGVDGDTQPAGNALVTTTPATVPPRASSPPRTSSSPPSSAPGTPLPTTGERDGLTCAAAVVMPPGAPYCFTAPAGLERIDLGDPTAGEEGSFRTSFGFGPADHIDVQAYVVGIDTDGLSDAEITAELAGVVADLESGGFDFPDEPTRMEVDGARGFVYAGTSDDDQQVITAHFIFRGVNEVQLNCAVTERAPIIDAACAEVLASMRIAA